MVIGGCGARTSTHVVTLCRPLCGVGVRGLSTWADILLWV
jgi:hypothetical protein